MKKLFLILISIFTFTIIVKADTGTKPSIELTIENLDTNNYIIDLLEYDEDNHYNSEMDYNGDGLTDEQILRLYKVNYDGWISTGVRWSDYIIFSDCAGNNEHKHTFSYFGTPTEYKVLIINLDDNTEKISDKIIRTDYNSVITIDYNTMKVKTSNSNSIINSLIILALTILVEFLIALLFKLKNYKLIILTNLISNIILQTILILFNITNVYLFLSLEILVFIFEILCYLKFIKNISHKKIIIYTIIANTITLLLTFIIR